MNIVKPYARIWLGFSQSNGIAMLQNCSQESKIVSAINNIVENPELRDDDEVVPPPVVVEEANNFVKKAAELMRKPMPPGSVSTFFGELNVTWRQGDRIVRLACFPDRGAKLQYGDLSLPMGSYSLDPNPTPEALATRLDQMTHRESKKIDS